MFTAKICFELILVDKFQDDIGKFLGEFEGAIMQDLVEKKIFSE